MSTIAATNLKNASSGTNNVVLNTDGTTTITAPSNIIKSATSQASTSGTAIDFTGIPSWVKRITVMLQGVSTSGTSNLIIQIGSTTFLTSGYAGAASTQAGALVSNSTGFGIAVSTVTAGDVDHGTAVLVLFSGNTWSESSIVSSSSASRAWYGAGTATLSGALDRIRITTVNGTDTFDAGTINILYEG